MRRQEFERRAGPILLGVIIVLVLLAVISRFMPSVAPPGNAPGNHPAATQPGNAQALPR